MCVFAAAGPSQIKASAGAGGSTLNFESVFFTHF
jgi:hypothetical protein